VARLRFWLTTAGNDQGRDAACALPGYGGVCSGSSTRWWSRWSWAAIGGDRREVTLKEQGRDVVTGKGCTVVAGEWTDTQYTPVP
jgi:hypothetical protein